MLSIGTADRLHAMGRDGRSTAVTTGQTDLRVKREAELADEEALERQVLLAAKHVRRERRVVPMYAQGATYLLPTSEYHCGSLNL